MKPTTSECINILKDLLNDYPVTSYCKLHCINQVKNQYKYYIIEIKESSTTGYDLIATYGRINSSKMVKVYIKNGSEKSCKVKAEQLRKAKLNKGYQEVENGAFVRDFKTA